MKTDLSAYIAEIARRILGPENKERSSRIELRFGTHGSVSVVIGGSDRGKWYDHENDFGGGPFEFIREKGRIPADQVRDWLLREIGVDIAQKEGSAGRRIVATYDYHDERQELLFQVVRFEPKDFRQRRPDGQGNWVWSTKGVRQIPYRLPELLAAPPNAAVFIRRGRKGRQKPRCSRAHRDVQRGRRCEEAKAQ